MTPVEATHASAELQRLMDSAREHQAAGRFAESKAAYRAALALPVPRSFAPAMAAAWNNYGNVLRALREDDGAADAYRRALALASGPTSAAYNLSSLLLEEGKLREAEAALRESLRRRPNHPDAQNNLGHLLLTGHRAAESIPLFRAAAAGDANHPTARANLGNALMMVGEREEGLAELRAAVAGNRLHGPTASSLLVALQHCETVSGAELAAAHRDFGATWRKAARDRYGLPNDPDPDRPLKIGYIATTFAASWIERMVLPLIAAHERGGFSIFAYDAGPTPGEVSEGLRSLGVEVQSLHGQPDEAVVSRIAADGIDILIDLSGHAIGNRLVALARRLAPVQLTWLGYPGGTGLTTIDGRISDATMDPPDEDRDAVDPVLRLDRPFLCFAPPRHTRVSPPPADRAGAITFGSFNSARKLSPKVAALWTRVVRSIPGSGLILKAQEFEDPSVVEAVRHMFASAGLSPGFLRIELPQEEHRDHLDAYRAIDIALDPAPYNGVATILDALWMGVPVVSLQADRPAGRAGCALLHAAGLGDLATTSEAAFLSAATGLARDAARRRALRSELRDRLLASPLCDVQGFARAMEALYRGAWRGWCRERGKTTSETTAAADGGESVEAAYGRANALHNEGKLDAAEAAFRAILETHPDHAASLHMCGMVAYARGRYTEALEKVRQSIVLDPGRMTMMANYGTILRALGRLEEAVEAYRRAYEIAPGNAELWSNVANVLKEQGRGAEARAAFAEAMRLDPNHASLHSNFLLLLNYDPAETAESLFAAHRRFAEKFEGPSEPFNNTRDPDRRLRIGLVSADFCIHSCAYFSLPLLQKVDRAAFEIFCYSTGKIVDAATAKVRERADHWRDFAWQTREALAAAIRADGIDILIDLAGHTRGNAMTVFARRSAPVQISWLGYPNTTGLSTMDYRIVDRWSDPPGEADRYHSEQLLRLDRCFLCYGTASDIPPIAARPDRPVVFGSFNSANKINAAVAGLWGRVLAAVPESRLVLKAAQFTDPGTRARFAALFAAAGIPAERLTLHGWEARSRAHLERYAEIDIALDCFPYAGTTTTCEALSMGVPVVTLAGQRHAARVGASLLRAAGLPELVAETPEDYVRIAAGLAGDTAKLGALRLTLRDRLRASELCDAAGFAAAMQAAWRTAWRRWCAAPQVRPGPTVPAIP